MKKCFLLLLVFFLFGSLNAAPKHSKNTKYPSYKGLVMAGYQGWFHQPRKGVMYPDENSVRIDMWPDVSEYEKTYPTGQKLADGSTARFFCSTDESTVDLHFKWMKEYGLDGVFMQRFFGAARPEARRRSTVLKHAMKAASKYGRAIGVMYDLSGLAAKGEDCSMLIDDWKYLVDSLRVTNQTGEQTYVFYNGKPLVTIWGVGFPDRPYDIRNIGLERFIDFLKNDPEYGGCSVMLGVPTHWRELNGDTESDPRLHELIKRCDVVMPWFVGRYNENSYPRYQKLIKDDIAWAKKNKVDYAPLAFPGFSWRNMKGHENSVQIPRNKGSFLWKQLSGAIKEGAEMIYVAMFDEIDEGTAIFKCAKKVPVGASTFVPIEEGIGSDHYLWLVGQAGKMLRKEKPLEMKQPERK